MTAIAFQKQFIPLILSGNKWQTVRKPRADKRAHAVVGEPLDLVQDGRTKARTVIGSPECVNYTPVHMRFGPPRNITIGNLPTNSSHLALDQFARADGFRDWAALEAWFAENHKATAEFSGYLIQWDSRYFTQPQEAAPVAPIKRRAKR